MGGYFPYTKASVWLLIELGPPRIGVIEDWLLDAIDRLLDIDLKKAIRLSPMGSSCSYVSATLFSIASMRVTCQVLYVGLGDVIPEATPNDRVTGRECTSPRTPNQ